MCVISYNVLFCFFFFLLVCFLFVLFFFFFINVSNVFMIALTDVKKWQTSYNQISENRTVSPSPGNANDAIIASASQTSYTQKVERCSPVTSGRNSPKVEYHQSSTSSKVILDQQKTSSLNSPMFRKLGAITGALL